ncbi:hypothetical protein BC833DRAFT_539908 [Globomyces pollinis-pini]|nr:hypothetical protein BC833DRAFT_539908 [Globomyces pollinis-pini]
MIGVPVLLLTTIIKASRFCPQPESLCVEGFPNNDSLCFTLYSSESGWAAIGFGSNRMVGSDMYIGWKNSTGGLTLSSRKGTGHTTPALNRIQNGWLLNSPTTAPVWTQLTFSFCRQIKVKNEADLNSNTNYIVAISSDPPKGNIDVIDAELRKHNAGSYSFVYDFVNDKGGDDTSQKPIIQPPKSFPIESIIAVHGVFMLVAWLVTPLIGIFIARYLKNLLGPKWFTLHMHMMGFMTILLSLVSAIVIYLFNDDPYLEGTHAKIGVVVVLLGVCQGALGYLSDHLFDENRVSVPWWDQLHWWLGRGVVLLATYNIYLGIQILHETEHSAYKLLNTSFWLIVVCGVVSFSLGQYYFGQINHTASNGYDLVEETQSVSDEQ